MCGATLRVKLGDKFLQLAGFDGRAQSSHQLLIIKKIMNGIEARTEDLPGFVQMAQIRPAVMATSITTAVFIQGPGVLLVFGISDSYIAIASK